jgi:hypothetical protein
LSLGTPLVAEQINDIICSRGRLDFYHMRINLLFKFVKNCLLSSNVNVSFLGRLFTVSAAFCNECTLVHLKLFAIQRKPFYELDAKRSVIFKPSAAKL